MSPPALRASGACAAGVAAADADVIQPDVVPQDDLSGGSIRSLRIRQCPECSAVPLGYDLDAADPAGQLTRVRGRFGDANSQRLGPWHAKAEKPVSPRESAVTCLARQYAEHESCFFPLPATDAPGNGRKRTRTRLRETPWRGARPRQSARASAAAGGPPDRANLSRSAATTVTNMVARV